MCWELINLYCSLVLLQLKKRAYNIDNPTETHPASPAQKNLSLTYIYELGHLSKWSSWGGGWHVWDLKPYLLLVHRWVPLPAWVRATDPSLSPSALKGCKSMNPNKCLVTVPSEKNVELWTCFKLKLKCFIILKVLVNWYLTNSINLINWCQSVNRLFSV